MVAAMFVIIILLLCLCAVLGHMASEADDEGAKLAAENVALRSRLADAYARNNEIRAHMAEGRDIMERLTDHWPEDWQ